MLRVCVRSRISEVLTALEVINQKIEPFITTQLQMWGPQIRGLETAIYIKTILSNKRWILISKLFCFYTQGDS